jgi:hypothetical protein
MIINLLSSYMILAYKKTLAQSLNYGFFVRGQFPPARMSRTYLRIESRSFNRNRLAERD